MSSRLPNQGEDNVTNIERFLLSQQGVAAARVWVSSGKILASVTIHGDATIGELDLRLACQKRLGKGNTPALFLLQRGLRKAA